MGIRGGLLCEVNAKKSYIKAHLSFFDVRFCGREWPGDDQNRRPINNHGRTKATGPRLQVQQGPLAAFICANVPVLTC